MRRWERKKGLEEWQQWRWWCNWIRGGGEERGERKPFSIFCFILESLLSGRRNTSLHPNSPTHLPSFLLSPYKPYLYALSSLSFSFFLPKLLTLTGFIYIIIHTRYMTLSFIYYMFWFFNFILLNFYFTIKTLIYLLLIFFYLICNFKIQT